MEKQQPASSEKNASIQLLRIIACVFVISTHTLMNFRVQEGVINYGVLLADSFTRCCVPIFLLLSGMYMFRGKRCKAVAKSVVLRIALPLFAVCVLLQVLGPFLTENRMVLGPVNLGAIASAFLTFSEAPISNGFYLWYLFAMLIVYCWYPLLRHVCVDEKKANNTRLYLLALGFFVTAVSPTLLSVVPSLQGKYSIPNPLGLYEVFLVVLGYELGRRYAAGGQRKWPFRLAGFALFVVGALLTYFLTVYVDIAADRQFDHLFFTYETVGPTVSAVGLILTFAHLDIKKKSVRRVISFIGDRTYVMYLVHWPIMLKLDYSGFSFLLRSRYPTLFFPAYILLVFIASAFLSSLVSAIGKAITRILQSMSQNKKPA